jgi:outer membrane receptor for ferrienterochelin and colicins
MKFIILITSVILISFSGYSQTFTVNGLVKDREGRLLQGVNVTVHGTDLGDATNSKGEYNITGLNRGEYIIFFSNIGYRTESRKLTIEKDRRLDISLDTEIITTDQVIVTAGKHEQKLSDLPVSASVIESKDILKYNHSNLREALKYVSGLNIIEDQLSIRGSSGYSNRVGARVLMAIDGIPFYTPDAGEIKWETLPVSEIERIEIIKGASSSLYGSTAIGGVVNIITREPNQPLTYVSSYIGGYDRPSHQIWDWSDSYRLFNGQSISHSNVFGKVKLSAAFTRLEDEGYRRNNFNKRYMGFLKTGINITERNSLNFIFNSLNQYSGNFAYWKDSRHALEPPDASLGETITSDRYMFGLISHNNLSSSFDLIFRGSYYNTNWSDETVSRNLVDADQYRGEVQTNFRATDNLLFINGVEINFSTVTSNIYGNSEALGSGIYSQADYNFDFPLILTGGIRFDYNYVNNSIEDYAFSPRVGLNYKLNENITLRTMAGSGFRAPSLAERFITTRLGGLEIKPNPELDPESNITYEAGILLSNAYFNFDAAVFRNEFYDMIEPIIDPGDQKIYFANVIRARIEGIELSLTPKLFTNLGLNFSYTFMSPRDLNKGITLKYRPRHLFYSSLSYMYSGFEAGTSFRYWSRVEEIDNELVQFGIIPHGDKRVEVYVLDLNTGYNFLQSGLPLRIYVNVKNLLNYNYVELIGKIAPIRNISLSFELFL